MNHAEESIVYYKILTGPNPEEIERTVNEWIEKGYKPFGGLVYSQASTDGRPAFHQPVVLTRAQTSRNLVEELKEAGMTVKPSSNGSSNGSLRRRYRVC